MRWLSVLLEVIGFAVQKVKPQPPMYPHPKEIEAERVRKERERRGL